MELLVYLYMSTAFIGLLSYFSQITKLTKDETKSESVSIISWAVWSYTSLVAFLYACLINGDGILMVTAGLNFTGCLVVTILLSYNRFLKTEGCSLAQMSGRLFFVKKIH